MDIFQGTFSCLENDKPCRPYKNIMMIITADCQERSWKGRSILISKHLPIQNILSYCMCVCGVCVCVRACVRVHTTVWDYTRGVNGVRFAPPSCQVWAVPGPSPSSPTLPDSLRYKLTPLSLPRHQQKPAWCVWLGSVFPFLATNAHHLPHLHMDVLEGKALGKKWASPCGLTGRLKRLP